MIDAFVYSYAVLWIIVILLVYIYITNYQRLKHNQSTLAKTNEGLILGTKFPDLNFSFISANIDFLNNQKNTIVIVASTMCLACKIVYPVIVPFQKKNPSMNIVLFILGDTYNVNEIINKYSLNDIIVAQASQEILIELRVRSYPFAYFLSNDSVIYEKGVINTEHHLDILLNKGLANLASRKVPMNSEHSNVYSGGA